MTPTSRLLTVVLSAGLALSVWPVRAAQRATREREVLVAILDKSDQPATGISPADLVVKEDGAVREVLRVEPSNAPLQVMVLVDTSAGTQILIPDVRKGVEVLAGTLWSKSPDSEVGLMEFGERPMQLAEPSRSASLLDKGLGRMAQHTGSGAYVLEAITEAAATLKKREAKHPVIVVFAMEDSREYSPQTSQKVEDTLKGANNVNLWAIELHGAGGAADMTDEGRQRNIVLGDVTTKSGGTRETALDRMNLESQFTKLADRLTSRYAVTYSRPDAMIPPSKLEVTVKRSGLRVLAPRWSGQ
jgi:hypothetical protein